VHGEQVVESEINLVEEQIHFEKDADHVKSGVVQLHLDETILPLDPLIAVQSIHLDPNNKYCGGQ